MGVGQRKELSDDDIAPTDDDSRQLTRQHGELDRWEGYSTKFLVFPRQPDSLAHVYSNFSLSESFPVAFPMPPSIMYTFWFYRFIQIYYDACQIVALVYVKTHKNYHKNLTTYSKK